VKAITAVVLDVDGTVVTCPYDFAAMRAAVAALAAGYGVDTATLGVRGVLEQIEAAATQIGDQGAAFRRQAEAAVAQIEVSVARSASFLPGAQEALARLRAEGLAILLITRNCRVVAHTVLAGFDGYDVLLTREDVPRVKPDPDHVLRALALVGQGPDAAVMVGDHAFDMQAGRAAGLPISVGVRTGGSTDASLLAAGAEVVLDSLADLPDWLADRVKVAT
jgi:phosphoglycolate phosphatase